MRQLLVAHALILFAAGVVLIISLNAIFHPVGVDVPPGVHVVAYLLAAGEIAIAWLSFSARRLTDASALPTIATFASFITASAFAQQVLVLQHVNVIDVRAASAATALKRDRVVIIEGEKIKTIATRAAIPRGARVIDARGKFLIPGLYDMHVHTLTENRTAFCFPLFLANGVTSVRDMGGTISAVDLKELREKVAAGVIDGPRIAAAAGRFVDGPGPHRDGFVNVATPEEGRAAVANAKEEGWDFIKVYNVLARDVYAAIIDEAKRQHIEVAGHVPFALTALEASDMHQRSIEHAADLVVSSSKDEADLRVRTEKEAAASPNPNWARAKIEIEAARTFDPKKAAKLGKKFAQNGTWQCPTLVLKSISGIADQSTLSTDARMQYIPTPLQERWRNTFTKLIEPMGPAADRAMRARVTQQIIGVMHRNGVQMLAGTDTPPQPYLFPGYSLHDELALFVGAGLTPLEALKTATINPARFLHEEKTRGSIDVGKVADAVLLGANPLTRIGATTEVEAVIVNGRYRGRADLEALKQAAGH